jgi:hypothetical protein
LRLDEYEAFFATPDCALLAIAEDLELLGVPLCEELIEMIRVSTAADPGSVAPTLAGAQIVAEPRTQAEETAGQMFYAILSLARDAESDDAFFRTMLERMALYGARFESYLAERTAPDPRPV